jgi:haloalkane dehalogenase
MRERPGKPIGSCHLRGRKRIDDNEWVKVSTATTNSYAVGLDPNPLVGVEDRLKNCAVRVRIVWGTADTIFSAKSPDYLDHIFPKSRGVRGVPDAKLFFPEEMPDLIAEEAARLWGV